MNKEQAGSGSWRRPLAFFALVLSVPVLLQAVPGYAGPVALGYMPLPPQHYHLAILLTGFCLWLAQDGAMRCAGAPSKRAALLSAAAAVICAGFALLLTHPSMFGARPAAGLPLPWGVALTLAMYAALVLPGLFAFGCLYPWRMARRGAKPAAACVLLATVFALCGIAATVWHAQLSAPALAVAGWILERVDAPALWMDAPHALISFRRYFTYVGPQCAALDGVALFIVLAAVLWLRNPRVPAWRAVVAIGTGAVILFLLNGVRIAAIVMVGAVSRTLATELFHGLLGILMVVGMLWLFDRAVLRSR